MLYRGRVQPRRRTPVLGIAIVVIGALLLVVPTGLTVAAFVLAPQGDTTALTWTMDGPTPYIGKVIGVFMNMDTMIGGAFDEGLANLKAIAEK